MKPILATLFALVLMAGVADAETCATAQPEVDTGDTPAGRWYVDADECDMPCFSIWVYQESNGIPGLQRGDETCTDHGCDCMESDTIVF